MHFHNKYLAEFFGTFWLVLGGCGSAVPVGHVSGGHFNPAVSIGLWVGGRFGFGHLIPYIIFQVLGAIAAAFVLFWFVSNAGDAAANLNAGAVPTLASNGFAEASPGGWSISIPVSNTSVNPARSTGPALVSSLFGEGGEVPLQQLPVFWLAPIVGGVLGAIIYRLIVSGAAPAESAAAPERERVEYREPEYRERAPAGDYDRDRGGEYRDRGEYRDYREDYRDDRY